MHVFGRPESEIKNLRKQTELICKIRSNLLSNIGYVLWLRLLGDVKALYVITEIAFLCNLIIAMTFCNSYRINCEDCNGYERCHFFPITVL